jgi:protein gp37
MADNTAIEWTDHTFNPWIGCQKVSPGCDHCYAETWDARGLQQRETRWGPHAARTRTSPANWRKPLAWNRAAQASGKRARVFCASLADVFDNHASIAQEWRDDLWTLIYRTPHLDWLLLTKRPQHIEETLERIQRHWAISGWPGLRTGNVWLGTSVEEQATADERIAHLLQAPAVPVRFLSMEPLLGPVDLTQAIYGPEAHRGPMNAFGHTDGFGYEINIQWVIVGGESGGQARPMHPQWVRSLRDQCEGANVPFFFKQWGEELPKGQGNHDLDERGLFRRESHVGGQTYYRVGKKAAGRLIDGREWNEVPS